MSEPERCHNCDHLVKNHNVKDGCNVYQGAGDTCDCPYEFSKREPEVSVADRPRCKNCNHPTGDHDIHGCQVGRAFTDTGSNCTCLFDFSGATALLAGYVDERPVVTPSGRVFSEVANPDRVKVADEQVGGDHYRQTPVQPWDAIDAWGLDFYAGSALKYLYRAGRKGAKLEDLKKLRHYVDKMIEKEEGDGVLRPEA